MNLVSKNFQNLIKLCLEGLGQTLTKLNKNKSSNLYNLGPICPTLVRLPDIFDVVYVGNQLGLEINMVTI